MDNPPTRKDQELGNLFDPDLVNSMTRTNSGSSIRLRAATG